METDSKLYISFTSRRNKKTGKKNQTPIADDPYEWMRDAAWAVKDETGHWPNMIALDEDNWKEWNRKWYNEVEVGEFLRENIKEIKILKRLGRSYTFFYYMKDRHQWRFPIDREEVIESGFNIPYPGEDKNGFGKERDKDRLSGVFLYSNIGTSVLAVECGKVIKVNKNNDNEPNSPGFRDSQSVWVKGASGIVIYGDVKASVKTGQEVTFDTEIGKVIGGTINPGLFLQLYDKDVTETVWWGSRDKKPSQLKDPTPYLFRSISISDPNSLRFVMED